MAIIIKHELSKDFQAANARFVEALLRLQIAKDALAKVADALAAATPKLQTAKNLIAIDGQNANSQRAVDSLYATIKRLLTRVDAAELIQFFVPPTNTTTDMAMSVTTVQDKVNAVLELVQEKLAMANVAVAEANAEVTKARAKCTAFSAPVDVLAVAKAAKDNCDVGAFTTLLQDMIHAIKTVNADSRQELADLFTDVFTCIHESTLDVTQKWHLVAKSYQCLRLDDQAPLGFIMQQAQLALPPVYFTLIHALWAPASAKTQAQASQQTSYAQGATTDLSSECDSLKMMNLSDTR